MLRCRTPEIMADAAHAIFSKDARAFTGQFLIDDTFLYAEGERDFEKYRVDPSHPLMPDFFVPADSTPPPASTRTARARTSPRRSGTRSGPTSSP